MKKMLNAVSASMKKHGLLKVISIILLILVITSWFVVNRSGSISYVGLGDLFLNVFRSLYFFFDTVLFVLVVGGFYGVLNKTEAYKKLLDTIVSKVKKHDKLFIYITIACFALVSSLTGMDMLILIFIPFVVSIILLLGYDKLVAISVTVVSSLIGFMGGIFVTFRDPSSYYSVVNTTMEEFVGMEDKFGNLFPKMLLLVLGVALLIFYVNGHIKNVEAKKVKYDLGEDDVVAVKDTKREKDAKKDKDKKKVRVWPLVVVLVFLFVYVVIGVIPWSSLFDISVFSDFHDWLVSLEIKDFAIFDNLISSSFYALGEWASLGTFMMPIIMLVVLCLVIKFICHLKFDDMLDSFVSGAKEMLPSALLIIVAYGVLVTAYNHGFFSNLIAESEYNIGLAGLYTLVGSVLHVDLYYTASGVFSSIVALVEDEALYPMLTVLFQGFFGLVNIVGPTSLLLITVLTYMDVPYTTWLKYIWRLFLYLFIVVCLILAIMLI